MAQYQITVDDAILEGLFQRDGGVAKRVESVVHQILQAQVQEQLMAAPYERTEARRGYRNGTVMRTLTTRVGRLVLHVPWVRNGKFSTDFFARYPRSEQAFLLVRCQTHFMRPLLDAPPKALQKKVDQQVRAILDAPDLKTARWLKDAFVEAYAEKGPKVVQVLEDGFDDGTAVLVLPERYRRRLRTTNGVERLNEEIRRRERVIRIFPNRESAIRLLGAFLMEIDEEWTTGRKYLNMDEDEAWKKAQQAWRESNPACAKAA
ncbi:MAG: transposase [Hydrogenibacillus schlegelii]|uniref:Mutator family transposase n=1 Tax=Hydrogenibacillus schlegelii TaxID=1484 RepID=A0A947CX52_HYDSH|nr:transposase [Hydrogenibacillus schlegelii]